MSGVTPEALDRVERSLRERMDAGDALLTAHRAADQVALDLKAVETERRLENLNHEATRIQKVLEQSIPRETFENYAQSEQTAKELARRELQLWKDGVNANQTATVTSLKVWVAAAGLVITALTLIIRFIK